MGVVTIKQIMIELCKETGELGGANNQTIFGCLLDGVRDLTIHAMPTWETVENLTLNKYNAIDWPCSCVKPIITYIVRNGKPLALDIDDSVLSTVNTQAITFADANQEIQDFFRIDGYGYFPATYNWGLGEVYGFGGGYRHIGLVTHDKSRRQSFIKGCSLLSTDTFGMISKSDGLSNLKQLSIPSEYKEALEAFALYKYYRTRNPNLGAINRNVYKEEFTRVMKFSNDDNENAFIDALQSNYRSSPKL